MLSSLDMRDGMQLFLCAVIPVSYTHLIALRHSLSTALPKIYCFLYYIIIP